MTHYSPANCPHSAMNTDTCWGDSAYQMCPIDRRPGYVHEGHGQALHILSDQPSGFHVPFRHGSRHQKG